VTAALRAGSLDFSLLLWTSADSWAFFGNASKVVLSARPESLTPLSLSSSVVVPTIPPITSEAITKASHPKTAFLRC